MGAGRGLLDQPLTDPARSPPSQLHEYMQRTDGRQSTLRQPIPMGDALRLLMITRSKRTAAACEGKFRSQGKQTRATGAVTFAYDPNASATASATLRDGRSNSLYRQPPSLPPLVTF